MVAQIGLPYAYYEFKDNTVEAPPFVAFNFPDEDGLFADDVNYARLATLTIDLYTDDKDFVHEEQIEQLLTENDLPWTKESTFLGDERMWMTSYTTTVLLTPSNPAITTT